jgi:hypothetical protein
VVPIRSTKRDRCKCQDEGRSPSLHRAGAGEEEGYAVLLTFVLTALDEHLLSDLVGEVLSKNKSLRLL